MADEATNPPPSLPPYSEMILAAIDALKDEGATESSISNYIESTCASLPDDHTNILADQLTKLVADGQLVLTNDNYTRPESTVPAKRGRGRPPKAKDTAVPETAAEPDTQAPAPESAPEQTGSEVKRGRGRPRKDPNAPPSAKKVKATPPSSTGRPRGRPRKVQPELAGVEAN